MEQSIASFNEFFFFGLLTIAFFINYEKEPAL